MYDSNNKLNRCSHNGISQIDHSVAIAWAKSYYEDALAAGYLPEVPNVTSLKEFSCGCGCGCRSTSTDRQCLTCDKVLSSACRLKSKDVRVILQPISYFFYSQLNCFQGRCLNCVDNDVSPSEDDNFAKSQQPQGAQGGDTTTSATSTTDYGSSSSTMMSTQKMEERVLKKVSTYISQSTEQLVKEMQLEREKYADTVNQLMEMMVSFYDNYYYYHLHLTLQRKQMNDRAISAERRQESQAPSHCETQVCIYYTYSTRIMCAM